MHLENTVLIDEVLSLQAAHTPRLHINFILAAVES
jgi:hypothetical protein